MLLLSSGTPAHEDADGRRDAVKAVVEGLSWCWKSETTHSSSPWGLIPKWPTSGIQWPESCPNHHPHGWATGRLDAHGSGRARVNVAGCRFFSSRGGGACLLLPQGSACSLRGRGELASPTPALGEAVSPLDCSFSVCFGPQFHVSSP